MPALAWQLEQQVARLQLDQLTAMVDLRQPHEGLVEVSPGAGRLAGAQLLGIATACFAFSEEILSVESHVRGADLVAWYKESENRPVRIDARWRAVSPTPSEEFLAAVELVVSISTQLPDSPFQLAVQSELSASEVLRLLDAESLDYRPLALSPGVAKPVQPAEGPGCLLLRPSGTELSYAEMVHPADFRQGHLLADAEGDGTMRVSHELFSERLEKGVILRSRVRGVFVAREADTRIAAACYTHFAAAEPPLST